MFKGPHRNIVEKKLWEIVFFFVMKVKKILLGKKKVPPLGFPPRELKNRMLYFQNVPWNKRCPPPPQR